MKLGPYEVEVVAEFPVMHSGWELDDKGYLVKHEGKLKILLTDHGSFYFAKTKELEQKLKEYREALTKTKKALKAVYSQKLDIE